MKSISIFALVILLCHNSGAQRDSLHLSAQDSILLQSMQSQLQLTDFQWNVLDSLMRDDSGELQNLDKEHQRIARGNLQTAQRDSILSEIRLKKKSIKDLRELNIRLVLTPHQLVIYNEKIKPAVPSVIHMGINHDRMNCVVCKP